MARARLALWLGFGLAIALALALPGDARPRAPRAMLTPCASTEGLLCGFVSVPLDYAHPKGRKLRLFVTAQPPKDNPRGTILLLAGGPGEASTSVFDLTSGLWSSLFPGYDVAAYDDRGTGDSALLSCRGAKTAARCAAAIGPSRAFYGTRENVADMEAVRRALGVDRDRPFRAVVRDEAGARLRTRASEARRPTAPRLGRSLQRAGAARARHAARHLRCAAIDLPRRSLRRPRSRDGLRAAREQARGTSAPGARPHLSDRVGADAPPRAHRRARVARPRHHERPEHRDRSRVACRREGRARRTAEAPRAPRRADRGAVHRAGEQRGPLRDDVQRRAVPVALRDAGLETQLTAQERRRGRASDVVRGFGTWAAQGQAAECLGWPSGPAPAATGKLPDVPVLVLAGDRDVRTPSRDGIAIAGALPAGSSGRRAGRRPHGGELLDLCELGGSHVDRRPCSQAALRPRAAHDRAARADSRIGVRGEAGRRGPRARRADALRDDRHAA